MEKIILAFVATFAQERLQKETDIYCYLCEIEEGREFIMKPFISIEEVENYLSLNRGKYMLVMRDEIKILKSDSPFHCGLCLN